MRAVVESNAQCAHCRLDRIGATTEGNVRFFEVIVGAFPTFICVVAGDRGRSRRPDRPATGS